jgi:hypothetical protein
MAERAKQLLSKSGLMSLELPLTLIFRGYDDRLDQAAVELHETSMWILFRALEKSRNDLRVLATLEYFTSNEAIEVDESLTPREAYECHKPRIKRMIRKKLLQFDRGA